MTWALSLVIIAFVVFAELYSIRGLIYDLHKKVDYNTELYRKYNSVKWSADCAIEVLDNAKTVLEGHSDILCDEERKVICDITTTIKRLKETY